MDFGNVIPSMWCGDQGETSQGELMCSCQMEPSCMAEEGLESNRLVGCVHCLFASDVHMPCLVGVSFHSASVAWLFIICPVFPN